MCMGDCRTSRVETSFNHPHTVPYALATTRPFTLTDAFPMFPYQTRGAQSVTHKKISLCTRKYLK